MAQGKKEPGSFDIKAVRATIPMMSSILFWYNVANRVRVCLRSVVETMYTAMQVVWVLDFGTEGSTYLPAVK